jgi:hypothetical protein
VEALPGTRLQVPHCRVVRPAAQPASTSQSAGKPHGGSDTREHTKADTIQSSAATTRVPRTAVEDPTAYSPFPPQMCCSAAGSRPRPRPSEQMPCRPHLATLWSTLCTRLRQPPGAALSKSITASLTAAAARRAAPSPLAPSPACAAHTGKGESMPGSFRHVSGQGAHDLLRANFSPRDVVWPLWQERQPDCGRCAVSGSWLLVTSEGVDEPLTSRIAGMSTRYSRLPEAPGRGPRLLSAALLGDGDELRQTRTE